MLVYANHMVMNGENAEYCVLKAIGGWIKEQLGFGLHPEQLISPGDFSGELKGVPTYLKIVAAASHSPKLFFWKLNVPDKEVKGRQWQTELGLKVSADRIEFSCVLKTDELSALVSTPVMPSKPRVITYIVKNIKDSKDAGFVRPLVGDVTKEIRGGTDSYRAFLYEIERSERDYPIVLISPDQNGEYLINCNHLQGLLVGLAQVVKIAPDYDRYEMSEKIGQQWSAWHGAVNVIHIPKQSGFVRGRYFVADEIKDWGDTQQARIANILAWVTNDTNISKLKNRIRLEGVIQAAFRSKVAHAQLSVNSMDSDELKIQLQDAYNRIEEQGIYFENLVSENNVLEVELASAKSELDELSDILRKRDYRIASLQDLVDDSGSNKTSEYGVGVLFEIGCRKDDPTPEECLDAVEIRYSPQCIILESAKKSAQDANRFRDGRRLLDMLRRLVTHYRDQLMEGGDNEARKVFGQNEFAAKESETVMNSPKMRGYRTFSYLDQETEMFRHLKIGTSDDVCKTIRVHFHWDAANEKIVIGYCGKHLPVSEH